jgi:hypothetical protein
LWRWSASRLRVSLLPSGPCAQVRNAHRRGGDIRCSPGSWSGLQRTWRSTQSSLPQERSPRDRSLDDRCGAGHPSRPHPDPQPGGPGPDRGQPDQRRSDERADDLYVRPGRAPDELPAVRLDDDVRVGGIPMADSRTRCTEATRYGGSQSGTLHAGSKWRRIDNANRSRIHIPSIIRTGWCIRIPAHGANRCPVATGNRH